MFEKSIGSGDMGTVVTYETCENSSANSSSYSKLKSGNFFCIKDSTSTSLDVYGDFNTCTSACKWYNIVLQKKSNYSSCTKNFDKGRLKLEIVHNNGKLDTSNFSSPWGVSEQVDMFWMDEYTKKEIFMNYRVMELSDSARTFGVPEIENEQTSYRYRVEDIHVDTSEREMINPRIIGNVIADPVFIIYLNASSVKQTYERSYPTLIDTLSNIGGLIEVIGVPFTF